MSPVNWRTDVLRAFARRLSASSAPEAAQPEPESVQPEPETVQPQMEAARAEPAPDAGMAEAWSAGSASGAGAPEPAPTEPTPTEPAATVPPQSDFAAYASYLSPLKTRVYTDFDDAEKAIYLKTYTNLCGSPEAIVSLIRAVHYIVENEVPGALVECGVFMGGNIEVMIRVLQQLGVRDRDIFLYDTFAGMPRPDAVDDVELDGAMQRSWQANSTEADGDAGSDWMRAGIDVVRQRLEPLGYPPERLHFVKGMVEETIPDTAPEQIAILRLDTDFYASTKHEIVHLYPRLVPGGILILDDYGALPGCRFAIDQYAAEHRLRWFFNRIDAHVRLIVKPGP
jgi:O-methyltransferase